MSLACTLRGNYTLTDLIALLDTHYKDKRTLQQIRADFYRLRQRDDEDLSNFAIRICTMASTILYHDDFHENENTITGARRDVLFHGMHERYRPGLRYMIDPRNNRTYDELLEAAREIERQTPAPKTRDDTKRDGGGYRNGSLFPHKKLHGHTVPSKAHAAQIVEEGGAGDDCDEEHLVEAMKALNLDDDSRDEDVIVSKAQAAGVKKNVCFLCEEVGHFKSECKYAPVIKRLKELEGSRKASSGPQKKQDEGGATNGSLPKTA